MNETVTGEIKFVSPEYAGQLVQRIDQLVEQRDELLAVLKHITDRAGRRAILTLSTVDIAMMRDVIAKVERQP